MNKYELALVVNAKAEDDVRTATVEKAKEYIARYGGVVTEVEDWGKKRLAYDIQHMREAYFDKFDRYVYDTLDTIFYKCKSDEEYVYGVYFVPASLADKIDAVYASMHFEHIFIPDEYEGTPTHAYEELKEELAKLDEELVAMDQKISSVVADRIDELAAASVYLKKRSASFDIRKYAALTREKQNWMGLHCS